MIAIILAVLLIGLCFYLLAVVSEEFFVPSIDRIAARLKMSSEAAGATLLAAGSSAPEFFTSFFAIMGIAGSGHADIGAGTIVGSAIFNILVIVGVVAMFKSVKLQWKPVIRDQLFYILTILLLLFAFRDARITMTEAVVFIACYGVYVFAVINWKKWFDYHDPPAPEEEMGEPKNKLHAVTHKVIAVLVPDPKKRPKQFAWTFALSILVIAGLSWLLVEQIIFLADTLNINATFLALTVLAAGTSLPDLIGSVIVAKQGRGDMAVSNAIGSNIFDILICLGLPWALFIGINGGTIAVSNDNLLSSILLLFATVIAILFLLIVRNWRIGRRSGLILIGLYLAYCLYIAFTIA